MKAHFKITSALLAAIRTDLRRLHPFAHERVGFIGAGLAAAHDHLLILARHYRPVPDGEYLEDRNVGAMISAGAIRKARQWAMDEHLAIFHVHCHSGRGVPRFSGVDNRENARFIPNFMSVAPKRAHGAVVLSDNAAFGQVWLDQASRRAVIEKFHVVGVPLQTWRTT